MEAPTAESRVFEGEAEDGLPKPTSNVLCLFSSEMLPIWKYSKQHRVPVAWLTI